MSGRIGVIRWVVIGIGIPIPRLAVGQVGDDAVRLGETAKSWTLILTTLYHKGMPDTSTSFE